MKLDNNELYYELVLSKGKGRLTKKAEDLFLKLAYGAVNKLPSRNKDIEEDLLHSGIIALFTGWMPFDEELFSNAFAYLTEVFKRGAISGYNEYVKRKGEDDGFKVKVYSIESSNDGNGMHNIY